MPGKDTAPTIIRRVEEVHEGGHHGGGWKVAYADFMTAMMAFFLLLWILAASDEEKLRGLADYFTPTLAQAGNAAGDGTDLRPLTAPGAMQEAGLAEGAGSVPRFGEGSPLRVFDSRLRDAPAETVVEYADTPMDGGAPKADPEQPDPAAALAARLALDPVLAELGESLSVTAGTDGVTVEINDEERRSLFPRGSAEVGPEARAVIEAIGTAIGPGEEAIEIVGHTDAAVYREDRGYSNWELSADRANVTRRLLVEAGISPERIVKVSGVAATHPANTEDAFAPENRRISIRLSPAAR